MKKFITAIIIAALSSPAPAQWGAILSSRRSSAASYTLIYDSVNAGFTSSINFGASVNNPYAGLYAFNDVARTIGKVTVVLNSVGTITGKTLNLRIYSTNGSYDLVSVVGTSDNVTGGSWSNTSVDFVFSTPCSLSASTNYCFAVDLNGTDGSNYAQMVYITTALAASPPPGNLGYWYAGGLYITTYGTLSPQMKIYTTP